MVTPEFKEAYARWWYAAGQADNEFTDFLNSCSSDDGEDLLDFAESLISLRTFGPNPRAFDPPIRP